MIRTLVVATNNKHKLEEILQMTGNKFRLKNLTDIGCYDEIPETGSTFEENALQKACFVYDRYRIDCFADDSGLEVEALNNEPGVYSARYGGTRDPEANLQLVLQRMEGISNRKASFRSVIALIVDGNKHLFEGVINGTIREEKAGVSGFGYDPVFQPEGFSVTFAEMDMELKNRISHRGQALAKLMKFLSVA